MTTLTIYKLHFTSPLHIGDKKDNDYGISQKTIASDTMYAALTSCLAKSGIPVPDDGYLGCVISSLFPYYQQSADAVPVYFLPSPKQVKLPHVSDPNDIKKLKKVCWIDTALYGLILDGVNLFDGSAVDMKYVHNEFLTAADMDYDFVCSRVSQRISVSSRTLSEDAQTYYIDKISFMGESGLYFIAEGDTTLIDKALPMLALEGLGTDRNVGNGFFEYVKTTINLDVPTHADHCVTLSMFIPESKQQLDAMMASADIAYDIERRGGWITTHPFNGIRKNVIYSFVPGSIFLNHTEGVATTGRIVDLKPETIDVGHPIWRCGKTLLLPIII